MRDGTSRLLRKVIPSTNLQPDWLAVTVPQAARGSPHPPPPPPLESLEPLISREFKDMAMRVHKR